MVKKQQQQQKKKTFEILDFIAEWFKAKKKTKQLQNTFFFFYFEHQIIFDHCKNFSKGNKNKNKKKKQI